MAAEAKRAGADPAVRLVGQGVGYMAFAAANPTLFRLMFNRETDDFETPALAAASKAAREMHFAAIEAAIPQASAEVKVRMSDFAWATIARLHHPGPRRPDRRERILARAQGAQHGDAGGDGRDGRADGWGLRGALFNKITSS